MPPLCQERDKPWNRFGRLSGAGGVHKKYAACSKGGFAAACGAVAFYCITRGQNKELLGGSLYAVSCGMLALYGAIAAAFGFWIVSQAGFCALLLGPNSIWLTDILALAITGLLLAICKVGMSAVLDPQTIDEFYYSMRKQNAA